MLLILGRLLISQHGLCYLLGHVVSLSVFNALFKRKLPWSFILLPTLYLSMISPLRLLIMQLTLRLCGFELHRSTYLDFSIHSCVHYQIVSVIGFFLPFCILHSIEPEMQKVFIEVNWLIFPDACAQVLPGDSVCWRGGYRFSVIRLKADEALVFVFFSTHWFAFHLI